MDSSPFTTRSHCGHWSGSLAGLYQLSNLIIAVSYFAIPVFLYQLYARWKKDIPLTWVLLLFVSFITLCGVTHLTDIIVFYWAPYRLFTLLDCLTAAASVGTAIVLPFAVRFLGKLPSPDEHRELLVKWEKANLEKDKLIAELQEERQKEAVNMKRITDECRELRHMVRDKLQGKLMRVEIDELQAKIASLNSIPQGG